MAVTIYTSADASAPSLVPATAVADLLNLFKKCLVDGYGVKAPAGWGVPFEDATFTVFRPGAGSRPYLQMRKTSYSATIAWETMSGVNTGTNPSRADNAAFHDAIEVDRGGGAAPKPWVMAADARTCNLFIDAGNDGGYGPFVFGDIYSYKSGDAFHSIYIPTIQTRDTNPFKTYQWPTLNTSGTFTVGGAMPRPYTQTGTYIVNGLRGDNAVVPGSGSKLSGVLPYPNPAGGQIWLAPIYVQEGAGAYSRGKLRGMWHWMHPIAAVANGDTFNGTGEFAGKTFRIVKQAWDFALLNGVYVIETSDTWLTNP